MQEIKKKKEKIHGSGSKTTLIISNDELNDIMKIVRALKDSNILLKIVGKTIKNEIKQPKEGFLSLLLGTLVASLSRHLIAGKRILRAGYGNKMDF